jgi:hypothetical protein
MMNSYSVQEKVSHDSDDHSLPGVAEGNWKPVTFTYGTVNPHPTCTTFALQLWGVT